jgi:hypothetical protein
MRIFQKFDQRASFLHPDLFLAGRTAARLAAAVAKLCNTRLHDGVVDANPPRAAAAAAPPPGTQREGGEGLQIGAMHLTRAVASTS